jgi:hypothetical protein
VLNGLPSFFHLSALCVPGRTPDKRCQRATEKTNSFKTPGPNHDTQKTMAKSTEFWTIWGTRGLENSPQKLLRDPKGKPRMCVCLRARGRACVLLFMRVCVRVRMACVGPCVRACVCVRVCV